MSLTVTRTSGSAHDDADIDIAVPVDDGSDMLIECAGGCKKKILFFGFEKSEDWGEGVEGALCIDCRARPLKHASGSESW